jgi:hypothetical protein
MLIVFHHLSIGTEIEERTPSTVRKTAISDSRRKPGQPTFDIISKDNEQQIEEKYEVTISSHYDESGLKILSSKPMTGREDEE